MSFIRGSFFIFILDLDTLKTLSPKTLLLIKKQLSELHIHCVYSLDGTFRDIKSLFLAIEL